MATTLREYKVSETELRKYGLIIKDYLVDNSSQAVIENAYQSLVTRIFDLNHDIETHSDIFDELDTAERVEDFKYAQYLICWALLNTDENPITQEVDSVIANRLRLKKVNGYQK